jgi:hypothetical protein
MTPNPRDPSSGDDAPPPTPRWVKAFGLLIVILVLAFVVLHLTGNSLGNHRPG